MIHRNWDNRNDRLITYVRTYTVCTARRPFGSDHRNVYIMYDFVAFDDKSERARVQSIIPARRTSLYYTTSYTVVVVAVRR